MKHVASDTDNQALYTKYRPQKFEEVIGQDHVISPLRESIDKSKTTHAYLFSGSRGTGKTTIARIFARELGTHQHDLYEIDAASHTGVDTIRELLESVQTLPFNSKFKVYIFDEVHMLSKSAFNALLKTLEEPPAHVRFILATTEPERVPDTVRSRCEIYSFKMPTQEVLGEYVESICKKEKASIEKGVSELVALAGNGSFRDTLSILQKIIRSVGKGKITQEEVANLTGLPSTTLAIDILNSMADGNIDDISKTLNSLVEEQKNLKIFTDILLERFRAGLLLRLKSFDSSRSMLSEDEVKSINQITEKSPALFASKNLVILLNSYSQNGTSLMPQLPIELACIEIVENMK